MTPLRAWLRSPDLAAAVAPWVVARVLVLGALALATYMAEDLGAVAPNGRTHVDLLGWDAGLYRDITAHGYDGAPHEALRFFPLLPMAAAAAGFLLGDRPGAGVVVVANVAALASGVLLYRLARNETGDGDLGRRAAWLLALAPPAFSLVMGYAESLLLAASIAAFMFLRTRRWLLAGMAGLLAALSRPVGLLLMVPAAIEAGRGLRRAPPADRASRIAAVLGPLTGTLLFLGWMELRFGNALLPLEVQQEANRRGEFVDPVSGLMHAGRALLEGDAVGSGLHLPWAALLAVLVVVCLRRWPASYGAYAAVVVVAALTSRNLDSLERYGLSAFPVVLAAAGVVRRGWMETSVLVLSAGGLVAYSLLAFLGAYVP